MFDRYKTMPNPLEGKDVIEAAALDRQSDGGQ